MIILTQVSNAVPSILNLCLNENGAKYNQNLLVTVSCNTWHVWKIEVQERVINIHHYFFPWTSSSSCEISIWIQLYMIFIFQKEVSAAQGISYLRVLPMMFFLWDKGYVEENRTLYLSTTFFEDQDNFRPNRTITSTPNSHQIKSFDPSLIPQAQSVII